MNQRSTKIVQLLSKEKDEITVSGFAEYFQVSQKTIRNDMKEINEILDKNKRGMIDIKSGGLVSIPADFKDRSEERRVGKECRSRWSPYH